MTSLALSRRSRWHKAIAILSLVGLASVVASPWLLREWHAWRGYELFKEKKFVEASSHLVHVKDVAALVAAYFRLPAKHLYAQSLLVTGRDAEAILQYAELADLDPSDAALAFIVALHDGARSNRESAAARLERHKESSRCGPCKIAHGIFQSAAQAQPRVIAAKREQQVHLAGMKRPARCLVYRVGSAAASALADQMLGFIQPSMVRHLRASGMTKQAAERMVSIAVSLMQNVFGERIGDVAQGTVGLEVGCAQRVQLHEMLRLRSIPYVAGVEDWVEFKTLEEYIEKLPYARTYLGGAKSALEAGIHLRQLGALAIAYIKAYNAESDAQGSMRAADAYARSQCDAIKVAAQEPEFARKGVALLREGATLVPTEKSWLGTIKRYVWPF
jgi:hypothetical protein